MEWTKIKAKPKEKPYVAYAINGQNIQKEINEKVTIKLILNKHKEQLILNILNISGHEVVLGIPWLKKHNLIINQKNEEVILLIKQIAILS